MQDLGIKQPQHAIRALATGACITVLWLALGLVGKVLSAKHVELASAAPFLAVALIAMASMNANPIDARSLRLVLLPASVLLLLALTSSGASELSLMQLTFVTFALLAIGRLIGSYLGGLIDQPGMVTVTAYVAAIGDVFSFAHPDGITSRVLRSPRALQLLLLSMPTLDQRLFTPVAGVGDLVFASMFIASSRSAGLSPKRTLCAVVLGMVATALLTSWLDLSLPAIPAMSLFVVLVHREAWRLPVGQERRVLANLVVITLALAAFLIAARA